MKKLKYVLHTLAIALIMFTLILIISGCNKQIVDTVYNYNYAILKLPNGQIIEGKLQSWRDYDDSDQLQLKIDGVYYLCHSSDCVLMSKEV